MVLASRLDTKPVVYQYTHGWEQERNRKVKISIEKGSFKIEVFAMGENGEEPIATIDPAIVRIITLTNNPTDIRYFSDKNCSRQNWKELKEGKIKWVRIRYHLNQNHPFEDIRQVTLYLPAPLGGV